MKTIHKLNSQKLHFLLHNHFLISLSVALLAVDHINNNDTLLRNYDLNLHLVDGRCKEATVMQRFLDVYTNKKHKTYVGVLGILMLMMRENV